MVALRPTAKEEYDTQISEPTKLICNQPLMISSSDGFDDGDNDLGNRR